MAYARLMHGLVILLAVSGCGGPSYNASPAAPIPAGSEDMSGQHGTPSTRESGQISVLVVPYSDPDRQNAVFDADFRDAGIIAIQLRVRNSTDQAMHIRREKMALILPGGQHISSMSAHSAASLVEEKTGWSVYPSDVLVEAFFFLDIRQARDFTRAHESRAKRITDYETKEFKDVELPPGATASGFLFFKPPPGTAAFDAAMLNIPFISATGFTSGTISRPIDGVGFAGSEPDPSAIYVPRSRRGSKSCDSGGNPTQRWIGTWEAKAGDAVMTISISDHAVTGRIATADETYRLDGTVNPNGVIEADIESSVAEDGATLRGRFPLLVTTVDATGTEQYRSLTNLAFHLCS